MLPIVMVIDRQMLSWICEALVSASPGTLDLQRTCRDERDRDRTSPNDSVGGASVHLALGCGVIPHQTFQLGLGGWFASVSARWTPSNVIGSARSIKELRDSLLAYH